MPTMKLLNKLNSQMYWEEMPIFSSTKGQDDDNFFY